MLLKAFEEGANRPNMRYRVGIEHDDIVEVSYHLFQALGHLIDDLDEPPGRGAAALKHNEPLIDARGCAERSKGNCVLVCRYLVEVRYFGDLKGFGAGHHSHRRGPGERSSVPSRSRARIAVQKPKQCHRALAGNMEKKSRKTPGAKNSDTEVGRARKCQSQSPSAGGCRDIQGSDNPRYFFDVQSRQKKAGLNSGTDSDIVSQYLCAEALPKFLLIDELMTFRKRFPERGY